jgi:hypothetical protein
MREWAGYVICDLDGCLSDDRWRQSLLPTGRGSFAPYHAASENDTVVPCTLSDIMYDLRDETGAQRSLLLIVTGRSEEYRATTESWMVRNVPGVEFLLLMRPSVHDYRHAPGMKLALVEHLFNDRLCDPHGWERVVSAYDDRQDVLDAYPIPVRCRHLVTWPRGKTVPEILRSMADTYEERNAVYGDNFKNVAPFMNTLWPAGIPPALVMKDTWHLFELMVVKMTRFANSGLVHADSIHDIAVYSAMIESELSKNGKEDAH